MVLRKMQLKDYTAVDRLMTELHKIHVDNNPDFYMPLEHVYDEPTYKNIIDDPENICVLTIEKKEICAIIIVSVKCINAVGMIKQKVAHIEGLYVDPLWRRKGIARELFSFVEKELASRDIQYLNLMV